MLTRRERCRRGSEVGHRLDMDVGLSADGRPYPFADDGMLVDDQETDPPGR
jgi:hypothetical protein